MLPWKTMMVAAAVALSVDAASACEYQKGVTAQMSTPAPAQTATQVPATTPQPVQTAQTDPVPPATPIKPN